MFCAITSILTSFSLCSCGPSYKLRIDVGSLSVVWHRRHSENPLHLFTAKYTVSQAFFFVFFSSENSVKWSALHYECTPIHNAKHMKGSYICLIHLFVYCTHMSFLFLFLSLRSTDTLLMSFVCFFVSVQRGSLELANNLPTQSNAITHNFMLQNFCLAAILS